MDFAQTGTNSIHNEEVCSRAGEFSLRARSSGCASRGPTQLFWMQPGPSVGPLPKPSIARRAQSCGIDSSSSHHLSATPLCVPCQPPASHAPTTQSKSSQSLLFPLVAAVCLQERGISTDPATFFRSLPVYTSSPQHEQAATDQHEQALEMAYGAGARTDAMGGAANGAAFADAAAGVAATARSDAELVLGALRPTADP